MLDPSPEAAVIGIALNDRRALDDLDLLEPNDFRDERLGELWALIRAQHQAGKPHDVTTIAARARVDGLTADDVQSMAIMAPMGASADYYGDIVAKEALRDRLRAAGTRVAQLAQEADLDQLPDVAEVSRAEIDAAAKIGTSIAGIRAGDYFDEFLAEVGKTVKMIPTPWIDLDHLIGGLRPGAVYVIGARPGVGKSVVGLQLADAMVKHDNGHVLFSSLEMTRDEIMKRLIAQTATVPLSAFDPGGMDATRAAKIQGHAEQLRASNIHLDDRATLTPGAIRSTARTMARRGHLSGIVVDYLQLMQGAGKSIAPRHELVAGFSRSLKMLAKEMQVPVILLSQLNRNSTGKDGGLPGVADLRESGSIEQDADVVILLHQDREQAPGELFMKVGKNRHGATGNIQLAFEGHYSRAMTMGSGWSG